MVQPGPVVVMRAVLVCLLMSTFALAGCLSEDPAGSDAAPAGPLPEEDVPVTPDADGRPAELGQITERFEPQEPGVESDMRFLYGPFVVPMGQDLNRLSLELPVFNGFLTAVSPNLYFAETGEVPTNQQMHIHHAHWFRASDDVEDEYYTANLAWVFGTGEERTSGSFHDRADVDPDGPRYGIYIEQAEPQALIYMLHNKDAVNRVIYVTLDVRFLHGTAEQIEGAADCGTLAAEMECHAGRAVHNLYGKLWGSTFDVPRQPIAAGGDGTYIHPIDIPADWDTRLETDHLGRFFTAGHGGTLIASAGHLHPMGTEVVIANLGPEGSGCEADIDGDGLPGTTLLRSQKIEQVPGAFPHSEEYQMGATKFGYRAPIHEGDRITQFGVYSNDGYATYGAMSFTGMYVDREQVPPPREGGVCTVENTAPILLEGDPIGGDPTLGMWNRNWGERVPTHCGEHLGFAKCEPDPELAPTPGSASATIHIADFLYLPGDQSLGGDIGAPVTVQQGDTVTFVNEDVALNIRHTITSCKWPCAGMYVANYPLPDGDFDSGVLGNIDPIDGEVVPTVGDPLRFEIEGGLSPIWTLDTTDMEPGYYSFYCRIHPWMRGWLYIDGPGEDMLSPASSF